MPRRIEWMLEYGRTVQKVDDPAGLSVRMRSLTIVSKKLEGRLSNTMALLGEDDS